MKKQKAKPASARRKAKAQNRKEKDAPRSNWVKDRLVWLPINVHHESVLASMSEEKKTETEGEEKMEEANNNDCNIHDDHDDDGDDNDVDYEGDDDDDHIEHPHDEHPQDHSHPHGHGHHSSIGQEPNKDDHQRQQQQLLQRHHDFSIISWNVLADSYCQPSSHKHLPQKVQRRVFDRKKRQHHVREILNVLSTKLRPDLIALQEVDPPLGIADCLKDLGYDGAVETPSSPDRRTGRVDSCGLYFPLTKWRCLEDETVQLDDLATLQSGNNNNNSNHNNNDIGNRKEEPRERKTRRSNSMSSNLQGLQTSFIRKNVALLVRLEHIATGKEVIVAVAHLFWNPAYEYVKLCQAHYVATRIKEYCGGRDNVPVIFCGDFNSQPKGRVHQYLTEGEVNAKTAAPWYELSVENERRQRQGKGETTEESSLNEDMDSEMRKLSLTNGGETGNSGGPEGNRYPEVRFILDYTLNRLCRWLRILGLNAALETEEEESERTKQGRITIFERCRSECRSLVTTSSRLLQRKECPPGTYLLEAKCLANLETSMVDLLLSHGVKIQPSNMLSRCVVCNGSIKPVQDKSQIQEIFRLHGAPEILNHEVRDVFQCRGCSQGYWWCDKPTSSASRVMNQATRLLELCIRGGVPIDEDLGVFESEINTIRNQISLESEKQEQQDERAAEEDPLFSEVSDFGIRRPSLSNGESTPSRGTENSVANESVPEVRYLLDNTLNHFCKKLRILGLDTELETEEEEMERTTNGRIAIFERCRMERRTLVTASSKLLQRKDCPPGTYLMDTKSLENAEAALVDLFLSHGVKLQPVNMLTRCVACNGSVEEIEDDVQKQEILQARHAPEDLDRDALAVYKCYGKCQGRWWCEKSFAPRFKDRAIPLVEMCIRGGVSIDEDLGIFDFDINKIRSESEKEESEKEDEVPQFLNQRLDVVEWLQTERLKNPVSNLRSVYASPGSCDETLPFTNVTYDFVGHLDYILHQNDHTEVVDLLYVPKSYAELNDLGIPNGHLLPSYDWPSDHLAIGCRFAFTKTPSEADSVQHQSMALTEDATQAIVGSDDTAEENDSKATIAAVVPPPVQFNPIGDQSKAVNEETPPSTLWCGLIADGDNSDAAILPGVPPGPPPPPPPPVQVPNPAGHPDRCRCGCIPNVPSLFEMAELRKQARLKKQASQ